MKVLVLNGSPKENSGTMALTTAFINGFNAKGDCSVEMISVKEKEIQFCQGCLSCWFRQDGHCIIQDDMNELLDQMAASDVIIWSFPLYYHGIPAPLKALLDRTNPFLKISMRIEGEKIVHDKVVDLSARKNIVITSCGFPYYPDNFAPLKLQMNNILEAPIMICVCEAPLLTIPAPELTPLKNNLLALLTEAGKEFYKQGSVSEETLKALEKPMLPNDMYINSINRLKDQRKPPRY